MPGNTKSEVYCASPVTLRGPSIRGVSRPIGEATGDCCVVAIEAPWKSACRGHSQGMRQAALGQLDLESVLGLRLRTSQRGFGGLAEGRGVSRLAGQCSFGFRR